MFNNNNNYILSTEINANYKSKPARSLKNDNSSQEIPRYTHKGGKLF